MSFATFLEPEPEVMVSFAPLGAGASLAAPSRPEAFVRFAYQGPLRGAPMAAAPAPSRRSAWPAPRAPQVIIQYAAPKRPAVVAAPVGAQRQRTSAVAAPEAPPFEADAMRAAAEDLVRSRPVLGYADTEREAPPA